MPMTRDARLSIKLRKRNKSLPWRTCWALQMGTGRFFVRFFFIFFFPSRLSLSFCSLLLSLLCTNGLPLTSLPRTASRGATAVLDFGRVIQISLVDVQRLLFLLLKFSFLPVFSLFYAISV